MSFELGVLVLDKELVDKFRLDESDRVLQLQHAEQSHWSRTITDVELSLLLNAVLSDPASAYRQNQRVLNDGSESVRIKFVSTEIYAHPIALERRPIEALFPADVEIELKCDPDSAAQSGIAGFNIDVRLVFSTKACEQGYSVNPPTPTDVQVLDLWPKRTKSFGASIGQTWLISLPNSLTKQLVSTPRQQACRIFLFVRPVLVHSPKDEMRLFPLERLSR